MSLSRSFPSLCVVTFLGAAAWPDSMGALADPVRAPSVGARVPHAVPASATADLETTVPALDFRPDQLFIEIGTIKGANAPDFHGTAFWYNGHLGVVFAQGEQEGGISLFDFSNPAAPRLVGQARHSLQREGHTTGFIETDAGVLAVSLASNGLNLWDLNDVTDPIIYSNIPVDGIRPSDYDFGAWWTGVQGPWVYLTGGFNGLYVIDVSDLNNPVTVNQLSMGAGFRAGPLFVVGNLLIVSFSDGGQVRLYDISIPEEPTLIRDFTQVDRSYANMFNGGKLYCAMEVGGLEIVDVSNPEQPYTLSTTTALGSGGYVMVSEPYIYVGNSDAAYQFDATDPLHPIALGSARIQSEKSSDNDFVSIFGNMMVLSDDHQLGTENNGSRIYPVLSAPDTAAPRVNFVSPPDGAVAIAPTSRVGITLSEPVLVSSVNSASFVVRTSDGIHIPGRYSIQNNIVNFVPTAGFEPNVAYEVMIPAGGLADLAGNRTENPFVTHFTVGPIPLHPPRANAGEDVHGFPGQPTGFAAGRTLAGIGAISYSWNFGDGSPPAEFSSVNTAEHVYARPGHYSVVLTVRDSRGQVSRDECLATITYPVLDTPPAFSASLALDNLSQRVWSVNADGDSVTALDGISLAVEKEVQVGEQPTTLAVSPEGDLWVVAREDSRLIWIRADTLQAEVVATFRPGSRPYGVLVDGTRNAVYVSLEGTGEVVALDALTFAPRWTTVGLPSPRGLALVGDRLFVTRFISAPDHGEVQELDAPTGALLRTWTLVENPGPDSEIGSRGIPGYLSQIVPAPDGRRLYIPAVKQNTSRGLYRDGLPMTFETTNRAILLTLDLETGDEDLEVRLDFDNRDQASAIALTAAGDFGLVCFQGSQTVGVVDLLAGQQVASIPAVGHAPQGAIVLDDELLFVQNFLGRDVAVFDIGTTAVASSIVRLASLRTQSREPLSPEALLGKRIFYNASDPRMSRDSYISCAGCHLDGGSDQRVWDFTDRGEGLRRTTLLRGRAGMLHGPVHWSANFDEIQDFENDIRSAFQGLGFMSDDDFFEGSRSQTLGDKKAGFSPELDALAAYTATLYRADPSPHREPDGGLTPSARRGRDLFRSEAVGCATCHAGPHFTDSAGVDPPGNFVLHDVGTLSPASGHRMGQLLTGIDTPTLKGVWNNAPYLHDGSAGSLREILTSRNSTDQHGITSHLSESELGDLEDYLKQVDAHSGSPVVAAMVPRPGQSLQNTAAITLDFTSFLDPASVTGSSVSITREGAPVSGTLSVHRDRITFVPGAPLVPGTYAVAVGTGLQSVDGDSVVTWTGTFTLEGGELVKNLRVWSDRAASYALQSNLKPGSMIFGDREDPLILVPRRFRGLTYLQTASRDLMETRPALVSFELTAPARVRVAFDRTQNPLPAWAADFVNTGEYLVTTGYEYSPMRVYEATFPAGKVLLGGPRTDGGDFNKVNYVVFFEAVVD